MPVTVEKRPGDLARHLLFVCTPTLWPAWPFLPLVRRPGEGESEDEELGLMFDARTVCDLCGYSATVFLTNLFTIPAEIEQLLELPREVFDTGEELVRAGWRVD